MTERDKRVKELLLSFAKRRSAEFGQTPEETYRDLLKGLGEGGKGWVYEKKRDHFRCELIMAWVVIIAAIALTAMGRLSGTEFVATATLTLGIFKGFNSKNLKEKLKNGSSLVPGQGK